MTTDHDQVVLTLERLAIQDPGHRGVARLASLGSNDLATPDRPLAATARSLAEEAVHVGIVTGFITLAAEQPTAETDGPPGTLYLARVLFELGCTVTLIADSFATPVLAAGCDHWRLDQQIITEIPFEEGPAEGLARRSNDPEYNVRTDAWVRRFLGSPAAARLTHLIAIERPGPSHTLASLSLQHRQGPPPLDRFRRESPASSRNICHNMRGERINGYTAKTHRLFEAFAADRPSVATIGLGDGGNEIGMGRFCWELLADTIPHGHGGQIACRISTDYTIVAGTSNWAAYALAIATARLRNRLDVLKPLDVAAQQRLINCLVRQGGAVDAVTGRHEPTVDGLTPSEYFHCLGQLRRAVGLEE